MDRADGHSVRRLAGLAAQSVQRGRRIRVPDDRAVAGGDEERRRLALRATRDNRAIASGSGRRQARVIGVERAARRRAPTLRPGARGSSSRRRGTSRPVPGNRRAAGSASARRARASRGAAGGATGSAVATARTPAASGRVRARRGGGEGGALLVAALEPPGRAVHGGQRHLAGERHAVAVGQEVRDELGVRASRIEVAVVERPGARVEQLRRRAGPPAASRTTATWRRRGGGQVRVRRASAAARVQ